MPRHAITLQDHERALLRRDGLVSKLLGPGAHHLWSWSAELSVERIDLSCGYIKLTPELRAVLPEGAAVELNVRADQLALITLDGLPSTVLEPGRYALWQQRAEVKAWLYDTTALRAELSEPVAKLFARKDLQTHIVREHERAFVMCDGEVVDFLTPGKHQLWCRDRTIELLRVNVKEGYLDAMPELMRVLPAELATPLDVPEGHLALISIDGLASACLRPGQYALWRLGQQVTAKLYATTTLLTELPEAAWSKLSADMMQVVLVRPHERGLLYVDGKLERVLEAGRYGVHTINRHVEVKLVDLREQEVQIVGQEVMSADKVTLRSNLVVKFRVLDPVVCASAHEDLRAAIYTEAQLAARRTIAAATVDELLEGRNAASDTMRQDLQRRATPWGVEVLQIDLKDLILPGEMKALLNQVIEAEKRAQANVIMRREETAATRSQANTAKMMEANPTLMRLRELEAMRDIAGQIQHLTVVAGGDALMSQLRLGTQHS